MHNRVVPASKRTTVQTGWPLVIQGQRGSRWDTMTTGSRGIQGDICPNKFWAEAFLCICSRACLLNYIHTRISRSKRPEKLNVGALKDHKKPGFALSKVYMRLWKACLRSNIRFCWVICTSNMDQITILWYICLHLSPNTRTWNISHHCMYELCADQE